MPGGVSSIRNLLLVLDQADRRGVRFTLAPFSSRVADLISTRSLTSEPSEVERVEEAMRVNDRRHAATGKSSP